MRRCGVPSRGQQWHGILESLGRRGRVAKVLGCEIAMDGNQRLASIAGVPGEVVAYRWVARQLPASAHREEAPFDEQCDDWAKILIDERQVDVGVVVRG